MKISDIAAAKQLKIRFEVPDARSKFPKAADTYLSVERTDSPYEFIIQTFEQRSGSNHESVIGRVDASTADYLHDLLMGPDQGGLHSFFELENVEARWVEVQAYGFESLTDYQTDVILQIPRELAEHYTEQRLREMFVWTGLGKDAVFCLNYKNARRNQAEVRFLSRSAQIHANSTDRGIIVTSKSPSALRQDAYSGLPVNMFLAPNVHFVVDTGSSSEIDKKISDTIREMAEPKGYLDRWTAYEELSVQLRNEEADNFGKIPYFDVIREDDLDQTVLEFQISREDRVSFEQNISLEVRPSEDEDARAVFVGTVTRVKADSVVTVLKATNGIFEVPGSGILTLSTFGDRVISERRKRAKDRIIQKASPIKYLGALVENGTSHFSERWGSHKGVTKELEKSFERSKTLNEMQRIALETAINTPDIALIQGPPGTGKTTVIKAIQERFRELFEAEERQRQRADPEYTTHSPRILISSFQNEAVDNAIADPLPGDMPANRKGRRADIREQSTRALGEWYSRLKAELESGLNNEAMACFCATRRKLSDQYFAYVKSGESIDDAVQLIREYLALGEDCFPKETVRTAYEIIAAYNKGQSTSEDDEEAELRRLLEGQRIVAEAYADDGEDQAGKLLIYLRNHPGLDVDETDISAINEMYFSDESDTEVYHRYVSAVVKLMDTYGRIEHRLDLSDTESISQFLLKLADEYANGFLTANPDLSARTTIIVSDFLARLEQEYETVVSKYSLTTAATCQSALDWRNDNSQVYDLVIIDEAARANPLDLLIPMSMGKKIILVGDHKQLPPMLEPDIVKKLQENPEFRNIPDIEVSLFERLFEISFKEKSSHIKAVRLEQQYRMHPDICQFVSNVFYDGALKPGVSAEKRNSPLSINQGKALTFISVPITRGSETGDGSRSRMRRAEVETVIKELQSILRNDPGKRIGIITFYSAQAKALLEEIQKFLDEEQKRLVEVGTVDAFQGKAYDYVILSAVRSNEIKNDPQKSVGFLVKPNRLCVAFSRAQRQLIVCGDPNTLQQVDPFDKLMNLCKTGKEGLYREC